MTRRGWRIVRGAGAALAVAASVAACTSLAYTTQAVAGGAALLLKRRPIDRVLAGDGLDPDTRARLAEIAGIREFARRELALPVGDAYTTYVALGRDAVTWNVVATPELSLEARTWCFPFAGCVAYRGYFREERARRFAAKLAARGLDVTVNPSLAYSTLGWFEDPVLDTFLAYPDWQRVGLLVHELAHRELYLPDDTAFSESFAVAVEELGVGRWLERHGDASTRNLARSAEQEERRFDALRLDTRRALEALYASAASAPDKREGKRRLLARMREEHVRLREAGELGPRFDGWLERGTNNADLASVAHYGLWVPAFRALFAASGSFPGFYAAARELSELPATARSERLSALTHGATPVAGERSTDPPS